MKKREKTAAKKKTATKIGELCKEQWIFKVDPPIQPFDNEEKPAEYVLSSRNRPEMEVFLGGPEVYLFKCDRKGKVKKWADLPGSERGTRDILNPFKVLGYTLAGTEAEK